MIRLNPTEHQIQSAIVEWANHTNINKTLFKIGDFLFAIPNGGSRNILEAKKLRKEGVKKGVSDLFLALPMFDEDKGVRCGLWIEVKSRNGKLSNEQIEWFNLMRLHGYECEEVRSLEGGIDVIMNYLRIK